MEVSPLKEAVAKNDQLCISLPKKAIKTYSRKVPFRHVWSTLTSSGDCPDILLSMWSRRSVSLADSLSESLGGFSRNSKKFCISLSSSCVCGWTRPLFSFISNSAVSWTVFFSFSLVLGSHFLDVNWWGCIDCGVSPVSKLEELHLVILLLERRFYFVVH